MAKKKKLTKKEQRRLKRLAIQFGEYMITGGVWFWSGYVIIIGLDDYIGLFWANLLGNGVGLTLNFLLERYWVFKTRKQAKIGIATKRYLVYTFLNAFLLNFLILYGLRESFGIGPEIGQFIASGFFTVWNYVWYKNWVFVGDHKHKKPRRTRHHA
jgi:putative flippase GtrA